MSLGGLKKQINKANQVFMILICFLCSVISVSCDRRSATTTSVCSVRRLSSHLLVCDSVCDIDCRFIMLITILPSELDLLVICTPQNPGVIVSV